MRPARERLPLAAALIILLSAPASARRFLSQDAALKLALPGASLVERKTAYLTEEQQAALKAAARAPVESRLWTYYVGRSEGKILGYAYFDSIVVRTLPAVLMAAVTPEGELRFMELLSFDEPRDYLPHPRWLKLFQGKKNPVSLRVGGDIPSVSGATLTAEAFSESARRMLALHQLLHPETEK